LFPFFGGKVLFAKSEKRKKQGGKTETNAKRNYKSLRKCVEKTKKRAASVAPNSIFTTEIIKKSEQASEVL